MIYRGYRVFEYEKHREHMDCLIVQEQMRTTIPIYHVGVNMIDILSHVTIQTSEELNIEYKLKNKYDLITLKPNIEYMFNTAIMHRFDKEVIVKIRWRLNTGLRNAISDAYLFGPGFNNDVNILFAKLYE